MGEIVCIACGCTDSQACEGGCSWIAVDEQIGVGICSRCAAKPIRELLGQLAHDLNDPGRVSGVRIHRVAIEAV